MIHAYYDIIDWLKTKKRVLQMTEYKRFELLEGVYLTAVCTDACDRGCLGMTFLTQLTRETAAMNAVLPHVLLRGSGRLPDAEAIGNAMQRFDAEVAPTVCKLGELQAVGLRAVMRPDAEDFEPMATELCAMLLSPNTRGGLLRPDWVKAEAAHLAERQAHEPDDAEAIVHRRLIEEMCCFEDFALSPLGEAEDAESIHYQKLTRHYHDLKQKSPLEIFYCGAQQPRTAARILSELLAGMPRGAIDAELGTDVRMNSIEAEARTVCEEIPAPAQACIAVGWRLGEQMEDPDFTALRLLAACLEQALREKLDPAACVRLDMHKGLLTLVSPLTGTAETAREIIDAQLGLIAAGAVTPEALSAACAKQEAALRATAQNAVLLERYWLERAPLGLLYSPEELIGLLHEVTPADVTDAARGLECDMVYVRTEAHDDDIDEIPEA